MLENTQLTLIVTIHKLYTMVRNGQPWDVGDPHLSDHGLPIIHSIADKLGCIRAQGDIDLPVQSFFPEDETGMVELTIQLEAQQHILGTPSSSKARGDGGDAIIKDASFGEANPCGVNLCFPMLGRNHYQKDHNYLSPSPKSHIDSQGDDIAFTPAEFDLGAMLASPSLSSLPDQTFVIWYGRCP